ncbi:MAG: exodeoxyribonuclease VII large subunit [Candidatus Phytoplasma vitis]|nr:MAG: hypothetical protein M6G77_01400 [Candidatus Phytoplasma vitis]
MKYSIETCLDVADFLQRIDEFKDKYKKNKLPLIKGYIKRNQKGNFVITSQKNDNQEIKITGSSFKREMIDRSIIIQSKLINKYWTYQLEIIRWLFIEDITKENLQKNIKAIKSDGKIGILTNETDALSDIEWELKKANYKNYELFKVRIQGNEAIDDICKKIKEVNDKNQCDIILLSRGGGDESDINDVFNNLDIITAIKKSKIPIFTGIGHALNTTFSDLVAYNNAITPTSSIQNVLELIKSFDKVKNNYENHNDKLLDLHLDKIIQKIIKTPLEIVNIEFSNKNILIDIYNEDKNEDKNIIILNVFLLNKILNDYNFQIYLLKTNIISNLNLKQKVLYLNEEQLQKTIAFRFFSSANKPTNYNRNQKLLLINTNIIINFPL